MERWVALRELKGEASVRPYIYFSRIGVALSYLGRDPARCASLRLSVLLRLRKLDTEPQISNLYFTIGSAQDVV